MVGTHSADHVLARLRGFEGYIDRKSFKINVNF